MLTISINKSIKVRSSGGCNGVRSCWSCWSGASRWTRRAGASDIAFFTAWQGEVKYRGIGCAGIGDGGIRARRSRGDGAERNGGGIAFVAFDAAEVDGGHGVRVGVLVEVEYQIAVAVDREAGRGVVFVVGEEVAGVE